MSKLPETITRLEVIDDQGRSFSKWYGKDMHLNFSVQDDGRTVKVFLTRVEVYPQLDQLDKIFGVEDD